MQPRFAWSNSVVARDYAHSPADVWKSSLHPLKVSCPADVRHNDILILNMPLLVPGCHVQPLSVTPAHVGMSSMSVLKPGLTA